MDLFRISQTKYINDINGTGSKMYGARWNRPGVAALYTSQARSMAMLELIVHFASKSALKLSYSYISLAIDEKYIVEVDPKILPKDDLLPNDNRLWDITEHYFFEKNCLAIKVPSVIIPQEKNIIINCNHQNFNEIKVLGVELIDLDERFGKITE